MGFNHRKIFEGDVNEDRMVCVSRWRSLLKGNLPWPLLKRRRLTGTIVVILIFLWMLSVPLIIIVHSQPQTRDLAPRISDFFHIQRDPFFNLHNYQYLLNSHVCDSKNLNVLIIVHSKPDFFHKRKTIRETFGKVKKVNNTTLDIVFMLGKVFNTTLQKQVNAEFNVHKDMVQGNFVDNYKNMTHKHVMDLYWVEKHCPGIKTIVKIDDDVLVNPFNLVEYLQTASVKNNFHCLKLSSEMPNRDPTARYHIPYDQYPFEVLPTYCPGFAYITEPGVFRKLLLASRDIRYLNMDDVYVTGVLAIQGSVQHVDMSKRMFLCAVHNGLWFTIKSLIFILDENGSCKTDSRDLWKYMR